MQATHHNWGRRHVVAMAVLLLAALIVPVSGAADAATAPPPTGGTYTVYAAPSRINASATSWFAMGVVNNGPGRLGSFRVALPSGFVPRLPFGAALTPRGAWDLTLQTCTGTTPAPCAGAGTYVIQADARRSDGGDQISPGEGLAFLFQATASTRGGVYPWQTSATSDRQGAGTAFTPPTNPPTITVNSNAATALVVTDVPGDPVAGTPLSPTVQAIDAFGNVATGYRGTVHFTLGSSSPSAAVPDNYTFTAADAGQHTFTDGLVLTAAPAQSFSVTDQTNGLTSGSITVPISPAPASGLSLTLPGSTHAGTQQSWGVTAHDPYGNVASGYAGTVHFSVDGNYNDEALPPDYQFKTGDGGDGGTASFNAILDHAGTRYVTVSDGTLSATKSTVVSAAIAATVIVTPTRTTVTAGDTFDTRVTVVDAFNNPVTDYAGTLSFTPIPGESLPLPHAFVPADQGTFDFTGMQLTTAGAPSLDVSDGDGLKGHAVVNVNPGAATHLTVDSPPPSSTVTAGVGFNVAVSARDDYENVDTASIGAGTLDCGTALGTEACPTPSFSSGHTSVTPTLDVAGPGTLTIGLGSLSTQLNVTVQHNDPAKLVLTTAPPASITAGGSFGLAATVYDGYGNKISDDNGRTVTMSALPGNAPFPVSATTVNGVATFSNVVVNAAANYVLNIGDGALLSAPAMLDVTPAPAVGLKVVAPASVTAGSTFMATASVVDTFNNVVTSYPDTNVTLTALPTSNGLPATATTSSGVANFSGVALKTAASTTLSATTGALNGSTSLTVNAGAPASLTIVSLLDEGSLPRLPHPVVGQGFDTTVGFLDSQGNPADASGAVVTLTKTTGSVALTGVTSATVPTGATQVTIIGSTYLALENNVVFTASAAGLTPTPTPATIMTDVAGQAATILTTPGTPANLNSVDPFSDQPCVLSATQGTCSQYILPNGGTSSVYLYQTVCAGSVDTTGITCKTNGVLTAQLVNAIGQLLDGQGHALYTNAHPATLVVSCYKTLCTHPDKESAGEKWSLTELKEDAKANPLRVTVDLQGVPNAPATFTGDATICSKSGVVNAGKYFCLDPTLSKRDASGNYIQYLLFVGDPRAITH
jgi:hypothetical protein